METTIRGILEKEIEAFTHPSVLENFIEGFPIRFPTKSLEDCLFGLVVGLIFGRFASLIRMTGRNPTDAEKEEFWEMIERRTMEIKGKIKLVMNK